MNKLELKHIVGYLPYGLKVYTKYYDAIVEPTSISKDNYLLDELHYSEEGGDFDMLSLNDNGDTKPILRPMSDLHREIDGVVHIHEIGKILHDCEDWERFDSHDNTYRGVGYEQRGFDDSEYFELVWNSGAKWFGVDYPISEHENPFKVRSSFCYLSNFNQDVLDYLYQHHFDIHGLIEQGLAIDLNTL